MNPVRILQCGMRTAAVQHVRPDKDGHWPAVAGNRDFFPVLDAGQQLRQRSPCLRWSSTSRVNCTFLYTGVQLVTQARPPRQVSY